MQTKLFLASQSSTRYQLLLQAGLEFSVLEQVADEHACDWTLPLEAVVLSIAEHKMDQLVHIPVQLGDFWVITADTLCSDVQGVIHGKPADAADAAMMLRAQRGSWTRVATGFCVEHKRHNGGITTTVGRACEAVVSDVWFDVPDRAFDWYLNTSHALKAAGAMVIDGPGAQFVREIRGSYSNILGLPLYELMQALSSLGYPGL